MKNFMYGVLVVVMMIGCFVGGYYVANNKVTLAVDTAEEEYGTNTISVGVQNSKGLVEENAELQQQISDLKADNAEMQQQIQDAVDYIYNQEYEGILGTGILDGGVRLTTDEEQELVVELLGEDSEYYETYRELKDDGITVEFDEAKL